MLLAAQHNGVVVAYDVRTPDKPLWSLAAHASARERSVLRVTPAT
jgi:hypothetical protein